MFAVNSSNILRADDDICHDFAKSFGESLPTPCGITLDVGQNMMWIAHSFGLKRGQKMFMSSGLGSMGYSLPAAIGAFYALRTPVYAFCGDGGLQMNIQELQFLARERIPVTVICLNNNSLGMIRAFQERYFSANYAQTTPDSGFSSPDFEKIANAYGLPYCAVQNPDDVPDFSGQERPLFVEVSLPGDTNLKPSAGPAGAIYDQTPPMDRDLWKWALDL